MLLRAAEPKDAEAIAELSRQLGYPSQVGETLARLQRVAQHPATHAVYVAQGAGGELLGWVHVFASFHVESEPFAEIGGLVVAEPARGSGVGAALVGRAEEWALDRGLDAIRVRSNVIRERAHRFYERAGFTWVKNQVVLQKSLSAAAAAPSEGGRLPRSPTCASSGASSRRRVSSS